jgi:type I site-specific restriction-modification system R (restriction) subunit
LVVCVEEAHRSEKGFRTTRYSTLTPTLSILEQLTTAISEETAKRLVEAAEGVVRRVGVELGFRSS